VTRDIPNVSESTLRNLDEAGVIRIGACIKQGEHHRRQSHAEG